MDNLIPVNYDTEEPTVSARDLHEALEINKRFSAWFESNSQSFTSRCVKLCIVSSFFGFGVDFFRFFDVGKKLLYPPPNALS